jgi:membrane protease subunit (stomatin/prohibitin family)
MDDMSMGVGLLIFPQMYQQMEQNRKDNGKEKKTMAVCPHCGALNEHPYKFCRECGKRPETPRYPGDGAVFKVCPYCGTSLELPKPPRFCPFCTERLQ